MRYVIIETLIVTVLLVMTSSFDAKVKWLGYIAAGVCIGLAIAMFIEQ